MKYAIVTWLDAHCSDREFSALEAQHFVPLPTQSSGFLVASTPSGVTLAVDWFPETQTYKNGHFIGSDMIVKIEIREWHTEMLEVELVDDD
jgi:hypothetical protein